MSKIHNVVLAKRSYYGIKRFPLPWLLKQLEHFDPDWPTLCLDKPDYQEYASVLFFRSARRYGTLTPDKASKMLMECARRSGSGQPQATYDALGGRIRLEQGNIVGWYIEPRFSNFIPHPMYAEDAIDIESDADPWSSTLAKLGDKRCYLNDEYWMPTHGPYCPVPSMVRARGRKCPICGTQHMPVETPKGYRWRKKDEGFHYPNTPDIRLRIWYKYGEWTESLCPNKGCRALAEPFMRRRWSGSNEFIILKIFKEIITYDLDSNPHIRRAAEDFIRHARQVLGAGGDSTGRESHREAIGQYPEISGDRP